MDANRAREITDKVFLPSHDKDAGPFENMEEFLDYYYYIKHSVDLRVPTPVERHEEEYDHHLINENTHVCERCGISEEALAEEVANCSKLSDCKDYYNLCPSCCNRVKLHPVTGDHKNICDACGQFLLPPLMDKIVRARYEKLD